MPPKKDAANSVKAKKEAAASVTYEYNDIVLGKVKGYPAWPAIVIDPASAPKAVRQEQPKNHKTTIYCVRFFGEENHSFLTAKDISRLLPHEIDTFLSSNAKKTPQLKEAYEIAKDPEGYKKRTGEEDAPADEDDDADEIDELAEDDSKGKGKKKGAASTKKRKRDAEPAKKAAAKKGSAPASKKAKGGRNKKSKENIESEDDAEADADEEAPPAAKKAKKEDANDDPEMAKVREWRHKLQKGFLGKETPTEETLTSLDSLLKAVEEYSAITLEQLQQTKIGKVMRHIAALSDDKLPKDNEYQFRKRADDLVSKWAQALPSNQSNGVNGDASVEPLTAIA